MAAATEQRQPPPGGRSSRRTAIVVVVVSVLAIVGLYQGFRGLVASGITKGPDQMFGDQHLKTAVALIELHKVRYGLYPASLAELTFTGNWDDIALNSVRYAANATRSAYYLEVARGWAGKPELAMPAEFWQGTGYRQELASLLQK